MAKVKLIMPKMGESVSEATIITWNKNIGDKVDLDETIIEIATDKVDSEVPSTHEGILIEMLFKVDDVVNVGKPFAIIETESDSDNSEEQTETTKETNNNEPKEAIKIENEISTKIEENKTIIKSSGSRFYSPLVRSMASKEGISADELESIPGSGKDGRVTKTDIINYLSTRENTTVKEKNVSASVEKETQTKNIHKQPTKVNIPNTGEIEIVEMDRMRKLISEHMTMSKATSAHITSMVEARYDQYCKLEECCKGRI